MSKFVERCRIILKDKSIDYKINYAEKVISKYNLNKEVGEEFLHFIFFEDIKPTDREVSNEEINKLYDKFYNKLFSKSNYKYIEYWIQYNTQILQYNEFMDMLEKIEENHNKILSKGK